MSSDTHERPESGSIESEELSHLEVTTYVSLLDGATVVEIDTSAGAGRVRVYVNDGPVFDQESEQFGPHGRCTCVWHDDAGANHGCDRIGPHQQHVCGCGSHYVAA